MSDSKLENLVIDLINKSVALLEQGGEFLSGQLPELIEQYLQWKFYSNLISFSFGLFIILIFCFCTWKSLTYATENKGNYLSAYEKTEGIFPYLPLGIFSLVVGFIVLPWTYCSLQEMIQILVAPKVYLLEWAKSFVK